MKRLMISLMVLVFVVASAGLSMAEEYSYHAGELVDCKAGEYVMIKDEKGNTKTFPMTDVAIDGKKISQVHEWRKCDIKEKSVWLAARSGAVIDVSELPKGVTIQEIEEKIKDIRLKAIDELIKEGYHVSEPMIAFGGWRIAGREYQKDPSSKLLNELANYFWNLMLETM